MIMVSNMIQDQDIVCFAPGDWWGMNPSCTTHIMKRLAEKNKVIYINPISSDLFGMSRKKKRVARIIRKLKSVIKLFRRVNHNLYVVSPIFLPVQGTLLLDRVNNVLITMQLKLLQFFLKVKKPILWIGNVRVADFISHFNQQLVVYHVSDRLDECPYTHNKEKLRLRETTISQKSDLIVCVSKKLYEWKKDSKANVHYLPHGVDFTLFREAGEQNICLEELDKIPKPIAGYFGTMTANNDIELLLYCAHKLPDVSFVFAGQITGGDYSELLQMPNVYYLGRLPYEKIPFLCAGFDVCMLQWKINAWIRHCNPLKLFEYMASGRPIISVHIDEVAEKYSDVISIANNKKEFCNAITWELRNDTAERRNSRIRIAEQHSWDSHIEKLSQIIMDTIAAKQANGNENAQKYV